MASGIFANHAPLYRARGYFPRPIKLGAKSSPVRGWPTPDPELEPGIADSWLEQYGEMGIGLLMGSPLPDGTVLGAIDIDHDDFVRAAQVALGQPPSARIGKRGAVFFVRVQGDATFREFKIITDTGTVKVGELLCLKRLCVLPPTIHPDTGLPYRWVGRPLLETDFSELPLLAI